jgi:hypothetical protein
LIEGNPNPANVGPLLRAMGAVAPPAPVKMPVSPESSVAKKATVPAALSDGPRALKLWNVGLVLSAMRVKVYCAWTAGLVSRASKLARRRAAAGLIG